MMTESKLLKSTKAKPVILTALAFFSLALAFGLVLIESYKYPGFFARHTYLPFQPALIILLFLPQLILHRFLSKSTSLKLTYLLILLLAQIFLLRLYYYNQLLVDTYNNDEILYLTHHFDAKVLFTALQTVTLSFYFALLLFPKTIIALTSLFAQSAILLILFVLQAVTHILHLENNLHPNRPFRHWELTAVISILLLLAVEFFPFLLTHHTKILAEALLAYLCFGLLLRFSCPCQPSLWAYSLLALFALSIIKPLLHFLSPLYAFVVFLALISGITLSYKLLTSQNHKQ